MVEIILSATLSSLLTGFCFMVAFSVQMAEVKRDIKWMKDNPPFDDDTKKSIITSCANYVFIKESIETLKYRVDSNTVNLTGLRAEHERQMRENASS